MNTMCEVCKTSKMTTDHMATRCKRILGNKYVNRHDNVIRILIFNILKEYKIINKNRIRGFKLQKEYANKDLDIRIDKHIITDCNIKFNKPDITIIDKNNKTIKIIEIAITNALDLTKIENHKVQKYNELKNFLSSTYGYETFVIPFFISWDGLVTKRMSYVTRQLNIQTSVMAYLISGVIKDTSK